MVNFKEITKSDGEILVKTARSIVNEYLSTGEKMKLSEEIKKKFSFQSGIFVTLNNPHGLRGCIGYPLPDKKLSEALVESSISAAVNDPRFTQVKLEELDQIIFEVTVLTPPTLIQVENNSEYPSKIKIGEDGLIIKHKLNSGLLLPQVPLEYGWNQEEFLNHTCEKAGLPIDYWKIKDIEIQKFQGIVFKETSPNGNIIQQQM